MYALVIGSTITELHGQAFVDAAGIQHPGNVIDLWSAADLAAVGVLPIVDDAVPAGKVGINPTLALGIGQVLRHFGGYADEAPTPTVVGITITPVQGRLALLNAGLLDQVEAMVKGADRATQLWYDYATQWERTNPILNELGAALGLTSAQIDNLFTQAAAIKA